MLHRAVTSPLKAANALLILLMVALPASLPAAGVPIVGQVLAPGGGPAAKAEVVLEPIPATYERAVLRLAGRPGPDPVARTRTAADGTFELAAPEAGMWKVVASAPGMLAVEHRLIPLADATVLPAIRLTPAADLEVRLVDAEGKPRPGRVGAVPLDVRGAWRPQLRLAAAGADGVARLPLGRDEKIQLEVLADGHPLRVFTLYDETSVTVDVPAGVAGTVRVIDRQSRPLAAAVAFQGSALLPLGLSGEDGRMALVLQAEKAPAVRVSTADRWNGSFELDFGKAEGKTEDLRLDPPETIRGQVLDLSSRDPVGGALVWAVRGELAETDERGRYALDVGVYKSRFARAAAAGYLDGHSRLDEAGGGDDVAIGLTPAAAIGGKVTDRDGALLEGVEIELRLLPQSGRMSMTSSRMMREGWQGRTSRRGAFRVTGLPAGLGYRLTFTAEGFAPRTLDVDPLEPFEDRTGLGVVLEPGRLAFGRVVDQDEVPVAAAEVVLRPPPPAGDMSSVIRVMRSADAESSEPTHLTDAEGRFEIADLAPGPYDLEVSASGFAPAKVPGVKVTESSARTDFGTVVLVPGASIEGRVTDASGAAVAGAEIKVDTGHQRFMPGPQDSHLRGTTRTAADGRFEVGDLLPGQPVVVTVLKEGFGAESVTDVRPPTEEPLAIVLHRTGRLKGTVADRRGDPVEGARVMAHPDHRASMGSGTMALSRQRQRPTWATTDAEGRFAIADVEPVTLEVRVDADGYRQQVRTGVEVAAGAEVELDFVLETGAVIEGTVTTADGEPVAEAMISVSEQRDEFFGGGMTSASGQSGVDGRYRVTGAPTGPATINVHHAIGMQLAKVVEVRPGTNVVDLVLERGFEISGQVVGPDRAPVGGAALTVQQIMRAGGVRFWSGSSQATTAGDGTFTLSGITAGKYKLSASRAGYAEATSEEFEVAGDVAGVLIEMRRGATLKGRILGLDFDDLGSLALVAFGQGQRQGRVDFAGEYVIESLGAGTWYVQAQVASGRSVSLQVEIPEGVEEVVKDIEFGTGYTLTGIVLDGGQPLTGASVHAAGASGSAGSAVTGADGRFRVEGLKAGTYQVMVMAGPGIQHRETLELAGDQDLRIELATGGVSGVVRADSGEPLSGVSISLEPLGGGDDVWSRHSFGNQAETDSAGTFRVPRVRQGTWRVVATKSGYSPGEATVAVAGDATPSVEIRLSPTEGVTFEVVLESGLAPTAVHVALLDPSGRRIAGGLYAVSDGKARVSTVPPGRWELVVQADESAATRFVVHAPGDQGRLLLPAGGTLQIHVPELEQETIATVKLTGPDGKPFVSTAGLAFGQGEWLLYAGRTAVSNLLPGVWSFTIHHEGRTWSGGATVTPGAPTEVTLP